MLSALMTLFSPDGCIKVVEYGLGGSLVWRYRLSSGMEYSSMLELGETGEYIIGTNAHRSESHRAAQMRYHLKNFNALVIYYSLKLHRYCADRFSSL